MIPKSDPKIEYYELVPVMKPEPAALILTQALLTCVACGCTVTTMGANHGHDVLCAPCRDIMAAPLGEVLEELERRNLVIGGTDEEGDAKLRALVVQYGDGRG